MKKQRAWLQLFLVAGLFLYLYSPLLDHWLGNTHYGRPHTHLSLNTNLISDSAAHNETNDQGHEGHEAGVLCLLDINALLTILPDINLTPTWFLGFAENASLVFDLDAAYFSAASVFLSSLDPPPRI